MPFNKLNHNIHGEIRPRFKLAVAASPERVFELIQQKLQSDDSVTGTVTAQYGILKIPANETHYWSPELQIKTYEDETTEQQTLLRCLIGPRQSVWASFAITYGAIGFGSFFGGFYGLAQISLGKSSPFAWLLLVGIVLIAVVWIIAKIGQNTAKEQTHHLVSVLYHALDELELERVG